MFRLKKQRVETRDVQEVSEDQATQEEIPVEFRAAENIVVSGCILLTTSLNIILSYIFEFRKKYTTRKNSFQLKITTSKETIHQKKWKKQN